MTKATKLAAERRKIMDTVAELNKRKAEVDAELLKLDRDKVYAGDGVELSFTSVRGLNSALIEKRFPPSRRPELYKLTLDTKEVRKAFSANELEKYENVTTRINVKEVE